MGWANHSLPAALRVSLHKVMAHQIKVMDCCKSARVCKGRTPVSLMIDRCALHALEDTQLAGKDDTPIAVTVILHKLWQKHDPATLSLQCVGV